MRFPFVSRERYDEKCDELKALREKYEAVLTERATPNAEPKPNRRAAKPSGWAQDPMIDKLTADLGSVLTDPAAARAEAERIRREAFGGPL